MSDSASTSPAAAAVVGRLQPGQRVRVVQQIPQRDDVWTTTMEGEVVSFRQAKTGSWFAHSKDDRLWLDRLELKLDDGEISVCNLDQFSHLEVLPEPEPEPEPAPEPDPEPVAETDEAADSEPEATEATETETESDSS